MVDLRRQHWLTLGLLLVVAILLVVSVVPYLASWQHSVACETQARDLMYRLVQDPTTYQTFDAAVDTLRTQCPPAGMAAGSWPTLANASMQRGNHAWGAQEWDSAGEYYRLATAYAPQQAPAYRRLAEVLLYHQGEPAQALAQLDVAEVLDPREPYTYMLKAHSYAALQDVPRALAEAQRAVALANNGYAYLIQGEMLAKLARWTEALASYQTSIELDSNSGMTYYLMGNTLRELGRLDEARAAWQQAQQLDPSLSIPNP